jgi:hypothetical protein
MLHSLPQHIFIPYMDISYIQSYKLFYFIMDQDSNKHSLYSASFTNIQETLKEKKVNTFKDAQKLKLALLLTKHTQIDKESLNASCLNVT